MNNHKPLNPLIEFHQRTKVPFFKVRPNTESVECELKIKQKYFDYERHESRFKIVFFNLETKIIEVPKLEDNEVKANEKIYKFEDNEDVVTFPYEDIDDNEHILVEFKLQQYL